MPTGSASSVIKCREAEPEQAASHACIRGARRSGKRSRQARLPAEHRRHQWLDRCVVYVPGTWTFKTLHLGGSRRTPKSGTHTFHDRIKRQLDHVGLPPRPSRATMGLIILDKPLIQAASSARESGGAIRGRRRACDPG